MNTQEIEKKYPFIKGMSKKDIGRLMKFLMLGIVEFLTDDDVESRITIFLKDIMDMKEDARLP